MLYVIIDKRNRRNVGFGVYEEEVDITLSYVFYKALSANVEHNGSVPKTNIFLLSPFAFRIQRLPASGINAALTVTITAINHCGMNPAIRFNKAHTTYWSAHGIISSARGHRWLCTRPFYAKNGSDSETMVFWLNVMSFLAPPQRREIILTAGQNVKQ